MNLENIITSLLRLVADNSAPDSQLPLTKWSTPALDLLAKLLLGNPQAHIGPDCDITKTEAAHLLYFKYLRRIADDGALKRYAAMPSLQEVITVCTKTLVESAEFKRCGRTAQRIKIDRDAALEERILVDITNSYITGARTGIQRVVRELCARLPQELPARLIHFDAGSFSYIDFEDGEFAPVLENNCSSEVVFHPGDIYFDMDASWGDPLSKWEQYADLKQAGVRIMHLHYDAVPVLLPDHSHPNTVLRYLEHFIAAITFSDMFLCISHAVKDDLEKVIRHIGGKVPKMAVIPMGGNYAVPARVVIEQEQDVIRFSKRRRFLLCVGTVEPRKNYALLLKLLPLLTRLDISLIVIGKRGWEKDEVLASLDDAGQNSRHFGWFSNIDDATLEVLYGSCFAYLTTSFYEGYGLPVMEALARQCVVVSSDRGALPEAGNGMSLLFDPDQPRQLFSIIKKLAGDAAYYQQRKLLVQDYTALNWDQSSAAIVAHLRPYVQTVEQALPNHLLQLVYISISTENIQRSLQSFVLHAGSKRILVLTKDTMRQEMQEVLDTLQLDGVVLCDEDVLDSATLDERDHQARNFALRRALYCRDEIDEHFIAADDDCILLRPLPDNHFLDNGKFVGKQSFPSMSKWMASPFGPTSYDKGQWQSASLLRSYGYADVAYSAHQAQLLNKTIVGEIYREFSTTSVKNIDEWSLYFNVAERRYPNKFSCRPSTTLYWPNDCSSWVPAWFDSEVYFENYYPSNYAEGGPACMAGISDDANWQVKLLHCQSGYTQYAFQNLLGQLLPSAPCVLQQTRGPEGVAHLAVEHGVLSALPDLWLRIPFQGSDSDIALGYQIHAGDRLVVNGVPDVQRVSHNTGLMIKMPALPGEYSLTVRPAGYRDGMITISLFVFPLKGIQ